MRNKVIFLITFATILISICAVTISVSADFLDDFSDIDYAAKGWDTRLLFGRPALDYLYPLANRLSIRMPDYNTAIYLLNENTAANDSTVEVTFENVFSTHSEVGLICRWHDDGWYEFRAAVSGQYAGSFTLYKYDENRKADGENPFVTLHPETERIYSSDLRIGLNKQNTLKMICEGDQIRIFINGNEQTPPWNKKYIAEDFTDGTSGFSVWTEAPRGYAQIDVLKFRSLFNEE